MRVETETVPCIGVQVRPAVLEDIAWIVSCLPDFAAFYGTRHSLLGAAEHVDTVLRDLIERHVVLCAQREGAGNVGFMAGMYVPHIYNPELRVLAELLWWVVPQHRGSSAGSRLLDEFVRLGKEHSDWIIMNTIVGRTPVSPDALHRRGFRLHEQSYLLEAT